MVMPSGLSDALALAMLAVAAYCAGRVVIARALRRATDYSADAVHTAMGVAMAGMLTARLASNTPWIVVFAVAAGWFGVRTVRALVGAPVSVIGAGSHLRHLVSSGAMVYMLLASPAAAAASPATGSMTGMAGMTTASTGVRFPTLALILVALMIGYTVVVTDRTSRPRPSASEPADVHTLAPRSVACCQVAMNITMGYMLLTLL
jgi:hypothetical protein